MSKVFLGGTCNGTDWRDKLIPLLKTEYFNPVVMDWTDKCIEIEEEQKKICDIHLYTITSAMTGVYSIAESVESALTHGITCVFFVMPAGFNNWQLRSLNAVGGLITRAGGWYRSGDDLSVVAELCNRL